MTRRQKGKPKDKMTALDEKVLQGYPFPADQQPMRIGGDYLLQSQMVELPADLRQLHLLFTEKMLKAAIAQKALEHSLRSAARVDTFA